MFLTQPGYLASGISYLRAGVVHVTTVIKMLEKHELNCRTNQVKKQLVNHAISKRLKLK